MSLKFSQLQADVGQRLATNPLLAPLPLFLEDDPSLMADELAAFEQRFEQAVTAATGLGMALIVLSPLFKVADYSRNTGASLLITVPVALVENQEITRAQADPAKRLNALDIHQQCLRSLLGGYKFSGELSGRPEIGNNGLLYYYLMPEFRHGETAA